MAFKDKYPVLAEAVHDVFDTAGDIKLGLADGRLSIDEIVDAIPDDEAKAAIHRLLTALKALPNEFGELLHNPWDLMSGFVPYLMSEAQAVFK